MEASVSSRSVTVKIMLALTGLEPVAFGDIQYQLTGLHITYSRSETTWSVTAWRIKKNGELGNSSKTMYGWTGAFSGGIPEWLTELIDKHRPSTFDI